MKRNPRPTNMNLRTLKKLKMETSKLITFSRSLKSPTKYNDEVDTPIVEAIEQINQNPYLVPYGSCAGWGHREGKKWDGFPFLGVVFISRTIASEYAAKAKAAGFTIDVEDTDSRFNPEPSAHVASIMQKKYSCIDEIWQFAPNCIATSTFTSTGKSRVKKATAAEAKEFWEKAVRIFSNF